MAQLVEYLMSKHPNQESPTQEEHTGPLHTEGF